MAVCNCGGCWPVCEDEDGTDGILVEVVAEEEDVAVFLTGLPGSGTVSARGQPLVSRLIVGR